MVDSLSCPECRQRILKPVATDGKIRCGGCNAIFSAESDGAAVAATPAAVIQSGAFAGEPPPASYGMLIFAISVRALLTLAGFTALAKIPATTPISIVVGVVLYLVACVVLGIAELALAQAAVRLDRAAAQASWRSRRLRRPLTAVARGSLPYMLPLMMIGGVMIVSGVAGWDSGGDEVATPFFLIVSGLSTFLLGLVAAETRRWCWRMEQLGGFLFETHAQPGSLLPWALITAYASSLAAVYLFWFGDNARYFGRSVEFYAVVQLSSMLAMGLTLLSLLNPLAAFLNAWSRAQVPNRPQERLTHRKIMSMYRAARILLPVLGVVIVVAARVSYTSVVQVALYLSGLVLWACWLKRVRQRSAVMVASAEAGQPSRPLPISMRLVVVTLCLTSVALIASTIYDVATWPAFSFQVTTARIGLSIQCIIIALLLRDLLRAAMALEAKCPGSQAGGTL